MTVIAHVGQINRSLMGVVYQNNRKISQLFCFIPLCGNLTCAEKEGISILGLYIFFLIRQNSPDSAIHLNVKSYNNCS